MKKFVVEYRTPDFEKMSITCSGSLNDAIQEVYKQDQEHLKIGQYIPSYAIRVGNPGNSFPVLSFTREGKKEKLNLNQQETLVYLCEPLRTLIQKGKYHMTMDLQKSTVEVSKYSDLISIFKVKMISFAPGREFIQEVNAEFMKALTGKYTWMKGILGHSKFPIDVAVIKSVPGVSELIIQLNLNLK